VLHEISGCPSSEDVKRHPFAGTCHGNTKLCGDVKHFDHGQRVDGGLSWSTELHFLNVNIPN